MSLSEETCVCLLFGCIFLALLFRSLPAAGNSSPQIIPPASKPVPAQSTPLPLPERQLSPEEQRYRLESQLESQYRDEWAKDFEEQEQERYFREKFVEYEQARQWEEANSIEEMRNAIRIGQMVGMGGQVPDLMGNQMYQCYPTNQGYPMNQGYLMNRLNGQNMMGY